MATLTDLMDPSVGHPEIDAQHHATVHLMAEVHRAIGAEDLEATKAALEALWHGMVAHFATEDALMEEYAYPERNPHRMAHQLFLEDVKELFRTVGEEGLTEEVASWALHRVPEWIAFHVQTNDAPLARHIARKTAARAMAGMRGDPIADKPNRRDA